MEIIKNTILIKYPMIFSKKMKDTISYFEWNILSELVVQANYIVDTFNMWSAEFIEVQAHIGNVNNPHEVTAEQVDTYNKSTIDQKDADKLQEAKDYTYSKVEIDNKDTVVLMEVQEHINDTAVHVSPLDREKWDSMLPKDGSEPMEGDLNLGGYDIDVVNRIWFEQGGFIANIDGNDFTIELPNGQVFRFDDDGLDMNSNKITGLANGTDETDASTIKNIIDYIESHNNSEYSHDDIRLLIDNLDETKLSKNITSLVAETELSLSDLFVVDKGSGARKVSLATFASFLTTSAIELFTIVEELPTENQNPNTIYLLATESEDGGNQLLEYIWIENESRWELIGTVGVDLSDYYNKTQVDSLLNEKLDKVSTNDGSLRAYVKGATGEQQMTSVAVSTAAGSIAQRTASGSLAVNTPTAPNQAVNVQYFEDNQKLFEITYGTTTHAQITTALSENKIPACYYNNFWYVFVGQFGSGPDYLLCNMYPDSLRTIRVTPSNTYTSGKTDFETIVNKTNILNASSTTTQYPNAKIVYDNLETKQDALTAGDRISISGNVISAVGGYEPDEDTIILNENDELEATNVMIWGYE